MPSSNEFKQRLQLPIEGRFSRTDTMSPVAGMKGTRIAGTLPKKEGSNAYKGLYWGVMAFFMFSYLRPQDIIPLLAKLHPIVILVPILILGYLSSGKAVAFNRVSPIIKAMLFFNGVMVLSIPFSYLHGDSLYGAVYFFFTVLLICFLTTIVFNSFQRIEKLFLMLNLGIVIFSLDIVKKYLSGEGHDTIQGLVGGQMSNPNDLGVNFVLFLPMIYYYFLKGKYIFAKLFSLALFGVVLFGVLGTQSRGAELGALVVLALLFVKTERKGLALASGALALVVVLALAPSHALKRFGTIFSFAEGNDVNSMEYGNAETRMWFYESSIRMLLSRPLTGVGMDAWTRAYALDFRHPLDTTNRWPYSHSSYFQIMGELGLPGIITYFYLIYITLSALKSLEIRFKGNPDYRQQLYFIQCLRIGFIGFLITTAFQGFTYYPTGYNMMAIVFAMDSIYRFGVGREAVSSDKENGKRF